MTFSRFTGNRILYGLPEALKDPANFPKIQKAILNTLQTRHSHGDMMEWSACRSCTEKMLERRLLLKRLGFRNARQYMAWRQVHEEIVKMYPLVDWKKNKKQL